MNLDLVNTNSSSIALHNGTAPYAAWGQRAENEAEGGINFHEIYVIFRRNIWLVVALVVLALGAGLTMTLLTTPLYVASATVQIDQEADRVLTTEDVSPKSGSYDTERFLQTQVDVLQSRSMALRVAQALNLFNDPNFYASMRMKQPLGAARNDDRTRAMIVSVVQGGMSVDLPRQTRVLRISFKSPDPVFSKTLAESYANEFIKNNLQRKYDSSAYARDFLSKQLAEAKTRLEGSERALNSYARSASLIKTSDPTATKGPGGGGGSGTSITTSSLVQLNQAANDARAARIAAEEKWRNVAASSPMSSPDVLSNGAVQALLQKQAELQGQLNQELVRHRDGYPTVVQLRSQVAEADRQLKALASDIRNSIRGQYQIAARQEAALTGQVQSLKSSTLAEQDRSVRYNILQRETDTNRTLYDGLLQRFKEVSAAAGITTNNISIVDHADKPGGPSSPRLMVNLALAFLLGLVLAAAAVFVKEQMDDGVRHAEDIPHKLGLNLLGAIPKSVANETVVEALAAPRSAISEAYHALRTSLLYSSTERLPRILLVTSGQPGEGKTTTSYALAADLARLEKRVLLMDVDLRRPSMHRFFGVTNDRGVSSVLTGQQQIAEALQPTQMPHLSFMSSGPIPPSPTELLGSESMVHLLEEVGRMFDVVVLDGPPVLGLADAPILSSMAGATIFVIEAGRNRTKVSLGAIRRLRTARTRILGGVLTKFNPKGPGSSYYDNDYYYYGIENDKNSSKLRLS